MTGGGYVMVCRDCGMPLRPAGTSRDDYPGTYVHAAGRRCTGCYRAHRGDSERRPKYRRCKACKRSMVPRRQRARIGQVKHYGHGLCVGCAKARSEGRDKARDTPARYGIVPCPGCDTPTRSTKTKAADAPGTTVRRKAGYCHRCVESGKADQVQRVAKWSEQWAKANSAGSTKRNTRAGSKPRQISGRGTTRTAGTLS